MGLHTAEAVQRGSDYSGVGVHVAARVADLAGAGEIIASAETLHAAGRSPRPDVREVSLKGVAGPVRSPRWPGTSLNSLRGGAPSR